MTAMSLTMEEAARLAAVDQPLLTGRQANIQVAAYPLLRRRELRHSAPPTSA